MTPMTPLYETPNGRLAELVSLLTDQPLHVAFEAVNRSDTFPSLESDPWWIVASAMVSMRTKVEERELATIR